MIINILTLQCVWKSCSSRYSILQNIGQDSLWNMTQFTCFFSSVLLLNVLIHLISTCFKISVDLDTEAE